MFSNRQKYGSAVGSLAMKFAEDLKFAAKRPFNEEMLLTAEQIAAAVSDKLSRRTVEDWMQERRTPPDWTHDFILGRVKAAANRVLKKL